MMESRIGETGSEISNESDAGDAATGRVLSTTDARLAEIAARNPAVDEGIVRSVLNQVEELKKKYGVEPRTFSLRPAFSRAPMQSSAASQKSSSGRTN